MTNPQIATRPAAVDPFPHAPVPNFDPLARIYRWMEYFSFGPMLERCRFHFLPQCSRARRALVLGDGDGRFTVQLLASNREIEIDAVDAGAAMLDQLRRRAQRAVPGATDRLRTFHADIRNFVPDRRGYNLVVSHFFLDCLTDDEVERLIERILPHLTEDALWVVSEFSLPPNGWRRTAARLIIRFLYFAFNKMTHLSVKEIPDYPRAFSRLGFRHREKVNFLSGLLTTELWARENDPRIQNPIHASPRLPDLS